MTGIGDILISEEYKKRLNSIALIGVYYEIYKNIG